MRWQLNHQTNFMPVPILLPTTAQNETFGGVTYHIQGELVPALQVELSHSPPELHLVKLETMQHLGSGRFRIQIQKRFFKLRGVSTPAGQQL